MLNFALVGCGRIANRHADLLGGSHIPNARLAGVCDIRAERARALGEKHRVPHFCDMHEMMAQLGDRIDVINILTESGHHARHCLELAPYKKNLIVEKPMALTLEDADAMIRACDQHGVRLFVVQQNRYNRPVVKLREALEEGRFGKLVMGTVRVRWCREQAYYDQDAWRGTWALDGGVFTNQASHHVDLLMWMMGEPERVYAQSRTALVNIETEDTGVAVIQFRGGSLGIVEATTAARPVDLEGSLSILGEHGAVEIGGFAVNQMKTWAFAKKAPHDEDVLTNYRDNPPNVYGFGHARFFETVVQSITQGKPHLIDGLEGRRSLELITAIYESIETSQEIALRFRPSKCRLGGPRG